MARAIALQAVPGVPIAPTFVAGDRRRVRLTRAGGDRGSVIDTPRILVECFATTASGAPDIAQAEQDAYTIYDALADASNGGPWAGSYVSLWRGNTIADYPDPTQTKYARWQFLGDLYVLR